MISFTVNGKGVSVEVSLETPLLWVLRDRLNLAGAKFSCGAGLCGACMVHIDGERALSCLIPLEKVANRSVTEGLSADGTHPLQEAWLVECVSQCGYCQPGQIMSAAHLLNSIPKPTIEEIRKHMSANICRCGTYPRIIRAIQRAAGLR